jgi:hypothetical protein
MARMVNHLVCPHSLDSIGNHFLNLLRAIDGKLKVLRFQLALHDSD